MKKEEKRFQKIALIIVLAIAAIFIVFSIDSTKCKKSLVNNGKVIMMFAKLSHERIYGNGSKGVNTLFHRVVDGEEFIVQSKSFRKPVPNGMPIYVLYSFECDDCYSIINDSIIEYKGHRFENVYVKDKGYDYKITKIE